ncbi:hypothetical protein NM208_g720 [Fusarium decemcellulare]|uniref:Uncharacterized protein n=1 Tax=Fusarium decemcellulare TaxID=57161 RepID=A0ACC1SYN7_9HYPO|nr:hypothetical protein NM208_g720 [Fusarium decemcellulare]
MPQQLESGPQTAQGKDEVSQVASEQDKQPQPTGAPTLATDNTGTIPSNNNGDDASDDGSSTTLYDLLLNAKDDEHALHQLTSNWDQVKGTVNTHYPSAENKTSLHLAAENDFKNVVEKLLAEKADVFATDEDGWTPLHFACSAGHKEMAEMLLSSGATPEATDDYGMNALHIATMSGKGAVIEILLIKCPSLLDQRSTTLGWTPLMTAAKFRNEDMMDILIKHIRLLPELDQPPCLNNCDDEQNTPLMVACESRLENGVKALCKAGASGDIQDYVGRTALHYAVESRELGIAETLIEYMNHEALLMTDNYGLSAFDDFEFNLPSSPADGEQGPTDAFASILRPLVRRLIDGNMQKGALVWAAQNTKRHRIFRLLVESLLSKDVFYDASAENLNVFQWAVDSRLPWVLGLLIDNFPAGEDLEPIKKAEKLAKTMRESKSRKKESKKLTPNDRGVESDKSKSNYENQILDDMRSDLNDLIRAETYKRTLFKPVKPRDGLNDVLPKFFVTITQFFARRTEKQQGRTKWIKHSRSVQEVIYDKGPTRIAREAMKLWFGRPQPELKRPIVQQEGKEIETQLKWVHLPVTNIVWMEDLMKKILKEEKCSPEEIQSFTSFLRSSWVQVPDGTSASRCMRPLYAAKRADETAPGLNSDSKEVTDSRDKTKEKLGGVKSRALSVSAVYMPYLAFSKYFPTNSNEPSQREDSYNQLLKVYKGGALHQSPTLDEAYYHFASDGVSKKEQDVRNRSQVVTKYLKEEKDLRGGWTLIRVKQLWIWTILDEWVITATPHPIDENQEDDLPKDLLYHPATQEQIREAMPQSTFAAHIATLIANYCVDAYERKRSSRQEKTTKNNNNPSFDSQSVKEERSIRSIRQIFSDSVNRIARKEKQLFEEFHKSCGRNGSKRTKTTRTGKAGRSRKDTIDLTADKEKSPTIHVDGDLVKVLTTASNLACDVKDIRDELNILRSIVNFQQTVQKDMADNPESTSGITAHYFWEDIEELENVAKRVQESVNTTLNLVETEIANEQSRQAARQGRIILVFTVVTILFLPLSFLSSLFALDVTSFQQAPDWALIVICMFLVLASFAFFVPVASIAFPDRVADKWHKFWKSIQKVWKGLNEFLKRRESEEEHPEQAPELAIIDGNSETTSTELLEEVFKKGD